MPKLPSSGLAGVLLTGEAAFAVVSESLLNGVSSAPQPSSIEHSVANRNFGADNIFWTSNTVERFGRFGSIPELNYPISSGSYNCQNMTVNSSKIEKPKHKHTDDYC